MNENNMFPNDNFNRDFNNGGTENINFENINNGHNGQAPSNNGGYPNGNYNGQQNGQNQYNGQQQYNNQGQQYGGQGQNPYGEPQQYQYSEQYSNEDGSFTQSRTVQYSYQQTQGNNPMQMNNQIQMNNPMQGNQGMAPVDSFDFSQVSEYKKRLRGLKEVQDLTGEVEIQNPNSIVMFGQNASESISKVSDELLNSMKSVKAEEAGEMLVNLTKIMDKFDVKELEKTEKPSMLSKFVKGFGTSVAKLFQKYDTMGYEVEKVYVLLKKYETDIKESNANLKKLYDANIHYYQLLEKYIVAGEIALEEIEMYISQISNDPTINQEEKHMMVQKLEISKEMLSQRVYDLQIAENVAIQAAPMIQTIQMSNFNLMRKINSSFIVTLPIFKQCLAQAVILKRQEIQAKSIKQLDEKTNELIMRNAANTARQSVEIAKMASGSSVAISTLEKSYETILKGIEDTKAIQDANRNERMENSKKLEVIKGNMKRNIAKL